MAVANDRFILRLASGALGIALVVGVVLWGEGPLAAFAAGIAALATSELCAMTRQAQGRPNEALAVVVAAALPVAAAAYGAQGQVAVLAAGVVIAVVWMLAFARATVIGTGLSIFAAAYVGLLLSFLVLIRALPGGQTLVLVTFAGTWIVDTAAYGVGSTLGRHPLWARVSPKKTWEGTAGSVAITVGIFVLAGWIAGPRLFGSGVAAGLAPVATAALLGLVISVAATVGDLVESRMKREFATKDTGSLIPGHGGVLDRFDSLLFVAPAVYLMLRMLGWG